MDELTLALEIIGTIAFAISGAMVGIEKKMDILGIIILGCTTAVGGGIIRDLILGQTPPQAFAHPCYLMIAVVVSVIIFLPPVRRLFLRNSYPMQTALLIMDSLGLGIFTVVGIQAAGQPEKNRFLSMFVGVLTGVGGGVLRDMMSSNTPYIFRKHFYCTAAIIGAMVTVYLWQPLGATLAMLIGAALIFTLRMLAAKYHWRLPRA